MWEISSEGKNNNEYFSPSRNHRLRMAQDRFLQNIKGT